ncbi:hypothetical protein EJ06DRAFT_472094 [Trichodelitschia bisporula]|uniref:HypA-like protein n=1 Tax=Trichodelitschia bisporula TaxID=703511 RepID=A0A6G1I4Q4_9PEZI|nr:hypothetical protein EJ06DRAFT_472094 [Trichodelitschia bisporula]
MTSVSPSPTHFNLTNAPGASPPFRTPPEGSLETASKLLQENHERFHIFFNEDGFHNHIAHHLATLHALGASTSQLQSAFSNNTSYQWRLKPATQDLSNPDTFAKTLGSNDDYASYLRFFEAYLSTHSVPNTLSTYLFTHTPQANDLLVRLVSGLLHPLLHLGFALRTAQPALTAEALAMAAVHDNWMGKLLLPAEERAASTNAASTPAFLALVDEMRTDPTIASAPHWSDGNKIRDGLLGRAAEPTIAGLARWRVAPTEEAVAKATAQVLDGTAWLTLGAQREGKAPRMDFFLIHGVNAAGVWAPVLLGRGLGREIKVKDRARLCEWIGRVAILNYLARGAPEPRLEAVEGWGTGDGWDSVLERACELPDDGHAAKVVRALREGEDICKGVEGGKMEGKWLKGAALLVDSVEGHEDRWVRGAGFKEAWEGVPAKL